jgi:hypothetical protein
LAFGETGGCAGLSGVLAGALAGGARRLRVWLRILRRSVSGPGLATRIAGSAPAGWCGLRRFGRSRLLLLLLLLLWRTRQTIQHKHDHNRRTERCNRHAKPAGGLFVQHRIGLSHHDRRHGMGRGIGQGTGCVVIAHDRSPSLDVENNPGMELLVPVAPWQKIRARRRSPPK